MFSGREQNIFRRVATLALLSLLIPANADSQTASPDAPHDANAQISIGCLTCHDMVAFDQPNLIPTDSFISDADNIDWTLYNALCWGCHNGYDGIPFAATHSSRMTSSRYGDWTIECWVCHNQHSQMQLKSYAPASYIYTGTSTEVTATTITVDGTPWDENEFQDMIVAPDASDTSANYSIESNTSNTLTIKGSFDPAATTGTFGIVRGKFIRDHIHLEDITDPSVTKSGKKTVRFYSSSGDNSFADGNGEVDGICEVCHTQTNHFTNTGEVNVTQSGHDHTSTVGTNCIQCHDHENGFAHGGGGSGCIECHGHDAGSDYDPDMNANDDGLVLEAADHPGHGSFQSHSTHTESWKGSPSVFGSAYDDDQRGPGIYCDTCHDITDMYKFKNQDGSGGHELDDTDICDKCHSPGGSYNGVDSVTGSIGAKDNWRYGVYNSDGSLKLGKEKWCAGCHDEERSYNFADGSGSQAPNIVGDEDGEYNYGTGWGFYKTGHGVPGDETIPASGGAKDGPGRGCVDCHDTTLGHLNNDDRTFDCDNTSGGACSSSYQSGYRLKSIGGAVPMEMPYTGRNYESFRLCFSCHTNSDDWLSSDLDYRDKTNFYEPGRSPEANLHIYHLRWSQGSELDWDAGTEVNMSCITCHNVHGSKNVAMIRSGELVGKASMSVRYGNDCSKHNNDTEEPVPNNITLDISTKSTMLAKLASPYCSHCHGTGSGVVNVVRDPLGVADRAPELNWVGGPAFNSDGADPDAAPSGTGFTFQVEYSDVNQDGPPDMIQLRIDRNNDGSYDDNIDPSLDELIDMTTAFVEEDTCAPYSTGVDYITTLVLDKNLLISGNTVTYKFYAEHSGVPATGPATGESTLTILNNGPALEWTGEPDYTDDGVNPEYGALNGTYGFRVKYIDDDGDACPTSGSSAIQVWIDLEGDGYEEDDKHNLTEVASGDTNCTSGDDGKLYYLNQNISSAGTHNYRFYASDGTDEATGAPADTGGSVTVAAGPNNPPFLTWESDTCRPEGAYPVRSALTSTLSFTVRYFDEDNQCPTGGVAEDIQVYVDLLNNGNYTDPGEMIDMDPADGDADCTVAGGGKLYTVTVTPTTAADNISYQFHATDGTDEALGAPRTVGGTVDVIDADYVVKQDGTEDYTTISAALSTGTGGDVILVYDGTYPEYLQWPKWEWRYFYSACGPEETIISHTNDPVVFFNHSGASVIDGFTVTGSSGRGIFSDGTNFDGEQSRPIINDSIIRNNTGRGIEGAESDITITGCEIHNNGGGVLSYDTTITDSIIRDNSVTGNGGGIASRNPGGIISLSNVVIKDNTASGAGGGIYCRHSSNSSYAPSYEKITLSGNQSTGGTGGGGYFSYCNPTFTNSLVSDNRALNGGGIGLGTASGVWFENSTIVNNTATTGDGGAYHTSGLGNRVSLANSIAWGNRAATAGHIGRFAQTSGSVVDAYLYDSIIENNGDDNITDDNYFVSSGYVNVVDTGTNYDTDPNFVDPNASGDYHLLSPSDAINNAADNSLRGIPTDDLEGSSRPPGNEDIGAYEYQGAGYGADPVLSWTGQAGYVDDGINPDSGPGGADYEFRVQYNHDDDVMPDPIQVWIDMDGNDAFGTDEKHIMTVLDSDDPAKEDGDYTNGEWFTKTIALYKNGGGDVSYRFYASDGIDLAAEEPTLTKTVYVANAVPALSWVGDTDYERDGVNPGSATSGSDFTFRVLYTDIDNLSDTVPPTMVVYVDLNDDQSYDEGTEKFDLNPEAGADAFHDGDYANGEVLVSAAIPISHTGDGQLNYRFYVTDGTDEATGLPTADKTLTITRSITGTVYTDEGSTTIGDGQGAVVRVMVNGVSTGTSPTSGGVYSVESSIGVGDTILVYIDGHASHKGTSVTVSGVSVPSDLHIYADRLIVRHDNSSSMTNALLDTAEGSGGDTDILYSVSGSDLTVNGSSTELFIPTGHTFLPGGAVTTADLDINGSLDTQAHALNVSGNWDVTGGSFSSSGTVTLDGSNQSIYGSTTFYNLTKSVSSADILTFEAGQTTTIANAIILGGASSQLLTLASSTGSSHWNFTISSGASKTIEYVDVSWSDASGTDVSHKPILPTSSNDGGNNLDWFTLSNSPPVAPSNSYPNGESEVARSPLLSASTFTDPDEGKGDEHNASQWQISTASGAGFAAGIIYDTGAVDDLESHTAQVALNGNTTYYWRVRYQDSMGLAWSDYSSDTSFTTITLDLPDGALSYWKFDEGVDSTAYDSVGSNHGTLINNATWTTSGKFDDAIVFDGITDSIDTGAGSATSLSVTGDMTIEAWVSSTADYNGRALVSKFWSGEYDLTFWNGKLAYFSDRDANAWRTDFNTTFVADGRWYHVVLVRDDTENSVRLYVDGVEDSVIGGFWSDPVASANKVFIGSNKDLDYSFNGVMDEMVIYDQILTPQDVQDRFTAAGNKLTFSAPDKPVNKEPTDGLPNQSVTPTLTCENYQDTENHDHTASRWQLRKDTGMYGDADSVDSGITSADLESITISTGSSWDAGANDWSYRRAINLSAAAVVDHMVSVVLTPDNFDYSNAKSDGSDIRFYDAGGTELAYNLLTWNDGGTSTIAVTIVTPGTSTIYMYYGNASATTTSDTALTGMDLSDNGYGQSIDFTGIWDTKKTGSGSGSNPGWTVAVTDSGATGHHVDISDDPGIYSGHIYVAQEFTVPNGLTSTSFDLDYMTFCSRSDRGGKVDILLMTPANWAALPDSTVLNIDSGVKGTYTFWAEELRAASAADSKVRWTSDSTVNNASLLTALQGYEGQQVVAVAAWTGWHTAEEEWGKLDNFVFNFTATTNPAITATVQREQSNPGSALDTATTYYWRVQHMDETGDWSLWSNETSFTTSGP